MDLLTPRSAFLDFGVHDFPATDGAFWIADEEKPPQFFLGMEEMLAYFEGVVCAVVNYSEEGFHNVKKDLEALGAQVRGSYSPDCTHLMSPYRLGRDYEQALVDRKVIVSHYWLADSVTQRKAILPESKVLYSPLPSHAGVPNMRDSRIAISGYQAGRVAELFELAQAAKVQIEERISHSTTHLIAFRSDCDEYAQALLLRLEGADVSITNHKWLEECVRHWANLPVSEPQFRKTGAELELEEAVFSERTSREATERQLALEERAHRRTEDLLEEEISAKVELKASLADAEQRLQALELAVGAEELGRLQAMQDQARTRYDFEHLQALLAASKASRAKQEAALESAENERTRLTNLLEEERKGRLLLQTQFSRSRQDLLAQLEARERALHSLRAELAADGLRLAEREEQVAAAQATNQAAKAKVSTMQQQLDNLAKLVDESIGEKQAAEQAVAAARKAQEDVQKQLETAKKEHGSLNIQLVAAQAALASKESAVGALEGELANQAKDIQEMMDEIERLRQFEPEPKEEEAPKLQAKLMLDQEVHFLDISREISRAEFLTAVGKVLVDIFAVRFDDDEKHRITIRSQDDLAAAIRLHEKSRQPFLKFYLEKVAMEAAPKEKSVGFFSRLKSLREPSMVPPIGPSPKAMGRAAHSPLSD